MVLIVSESGHHVGDAYKSDDLDKLQNSANAESQQERRQDQQHTVPLPVWAPNSRLLAPHNASQARDNGSWAGVAKLAEMGLCGIMFPAKHRRRDMGRDQWQRVEQGLRECQMMGPWLMLGKGAGSCRVQERWLLLSSSIGRCVRCSSQSCSTHADSWCSPPATRRVWPSADDRLPMLCPRDTECTAS